MQAPFRASRDSVLQRHNPGDSHQLWRDHTPVKEYSPTRPEGNQMQMHVYIAEPVWPIIRRIFRTMAGSEDADQSRSISRVGLVIGSSFAFFSASWNFLSRRFFLLFSALRDSSNLAWRWIASLLSPFTPSVRFLILRSSGGGTKDNTARSSGSIRSFAWQHGQTASKGSRGSWLIAPPTVSRCLFLPGAIPQIKPEVQCPAQLRPYGRFSLDVSFRLPFGV